MIARVTFQWMLALVVSVSVSLPGPARAEVPSRQMPVVAPLYAPILMYHHIGAPRAGRFSVTPAKFAEQLKWLRDQGYRSVSIDDIASAAQGGPPLPPKPIAITFDDGWRDQYDIALPLLKEFGFKATFFVVSGWVGRGRTLMTWAELRDLRARGHWVGSHSVTHGAAAKQTDKVVAYEVIQSRNTISRELGGPPTIFAYPLGSIDARAEALARAAGYVAAVDVQANPIQRATQLYRLKRIEVRGTYSLGNLASWLIAGKEGVIPVPRSPWWQTPAPIIPRVAPSGWGAWRPAWVLPR
ncbi:MAG TPA: polysaccharide deacetylase family protein [Thermoflexales bacterium]|nr:polysaccharide deacetylase family protein [Thermoflexales bacterium]